MAEEDDTPSATGAGAFHTKRPPVTIDLEAESVTSDRASAEPPRIEKEAASGEAAPAPPGPNAELARRLLPLAAAAVVGGLVGGFVAAFLLAPHTDSVSEASTDQRLLILSSRIDALEQKASETGAGNTIDPHRLAAIEAAVSALQRAAPAAASGDAAAAVQPLEQKLAALTARFEEAQRQQPPAIDLAPLKQQIETFGERLSTIEQHPPVDPETKAAARTIALTALRQAARGDKSFSAELESAETLQINVAALAPLAAAGAPSLATLQARFPAVAEAVRQASRKVDPEAGVFDRLAASASALVSVRPAGPVPGTSATAIVSRMEADVAKGDLAAALAESDALAPPVKSALADWADAARRRAAIDQALAALVASN